MFTLLSAFEYTRHINMHTRIADTFVFPSITVGQCTSKCNMFNYCLGFDYNKSTNRCYIKSQLIAPVSNLNTDFYLKSAPILSSITVNKNLVSGYFDASVQNIMIFGSGFNSSTTIALYLLNEYNATLMSASPSILSWNSSTIHFQYPSLGNLKDFYLYKPHNIRVQTNASGKLMNYTVPVRYPNGFASSPYKNPFKCSLDGQFIKVDPFIGFIHTKAGEELIMTATDNNGPNNLVAIEKEDTGMHLNDLYDNSNPPNLLGHRFEDPTIAKSNGYLFIDTANGYLIYNNGLYLGLDFNTMDNSFRYYSDIQSVAISDDRLVYWECTDNFSVYPTNVESTFMTNNSKFVVDLQRLELFGINFGPFQNRTTTFVDFEVVKNGRVILTDSRLADIWDDSNIKISYPQLNDLRFYYAYKPDFVNIVVHSSQGTSALMLTVRIPQIDATNPFQCFHKDGRSWKLLESDQSIRLNNGASVQLQADYNDGDGVMVKLKENITGKYLRHYANYLKSDFLNRDVFPYTNDFRYLIIKTNQGYVFYNSFELYQGNYIGYDTFY